MATILLIEDNKETARLVKKILEPRGHTIVHTASGLDGLRLARRALPDLVLLDFDRPDLGRPGGRQVHLASPPAF